jgi:ABC-type arginine/histidine transport system permease subunit
VPALVVIPSIVLVIDVTRFGRLFTQHYRILRLFIVLAVFVYLLILLILLQLIRLSNLRTVVHAVDHAKSPDVWLIGRARKSFNAKS